MLKFSEFEYERPDIDLFVKQMNVQLNSFESASCAEEQIICMEAIVELEREIISMMNICRIRNSLDTKDSFYDKEMTYINDIDPQVDSMMAKYYEVILKSSFKKQLEEKFGSFLFDVAQVNSEVIDDCILEELKEENRLCYEYSKLLSSDQIAFDGKILTRVQLGPYRESNDPSVRKAANKAYFSFFSEHQKSLDKIFDDLVKVRTTMANKLGYKNFTELAYKRMKRLDYDQDMVKVYRDQVKAHIVPICNELKDRQKSRLGCDVLKYYDLNYKFQSGNPKPKEGGEWIISTARQMYKEFSNDTNEFFKFMEASELMDLETRRYKGGGGYCSYIPKYQAPFIFSNLNGTLDDVTVLTHEFGHAFQCYSCKDVLVHEYQWPSMEAAEIHSQSMEFLTWPWMENFFLEDADKFRYMHLERALEFIPYGVAVDEFQHIIYNNPNLTPNQRHKEWKALEEIYLPHLDYDGLEYLEMGGFWQKQSHIYEDPFYYIDYTLALFCAFQYLVMSMKDRNKAWNSYLRLSKAGGSASFLNLLKLADLQSPFEEGTVKSITDTIVEWLDSIDDTKF